MIIKSMTRKSNYFRQPVKYIMHKRHDTLPQWVLLHNIDASPISQAEIIKAFKDNDQYRRKRANGIAMYHEVISFSDKDRATIIRNPYIMEEIAWQYITRRTNGLALAYPHYDTRSPHIHILMSANELQSKKSVRISKKRFQEIKQEMERLMIDRFPQLSHSVVWRHVKRSRSKGRER